MTAARGLPARAARLVLAAGAGAGFATSFAPHAMPALLVPALATITGLALTAAPRRASLEGFLFGFVGWGLLLRWFAAVLIEFSTLGPVVAAATVFAAGAIEGLLVVPWAFTVARLSRRYGPLPGALAAAVGWLGLEALRGVFPVPFPWGTLAAALSAVPPAVLLASGLGSSGLGLLASLLAAALALLAAGRPARRAAVAVAGLAGGLAAIGVVLAWSCRTEGPRTVTVAAVQGSLPRDADGWDRLVAYRGLTVEAAAAGATLVVWPESAVPYRIGSHAGFRDVLERLARSEGVDLVINSIGHEDPDRYFNEAVLVRADRGVSGSYRKRELAPFGEYLPMRFLFGRMPALAAEAGDFSPGTEPALLDARCGRIGALVCYEAVFPGLVAEQAADGAELLVNLTNDSWFGWTGGPAQHLAHARLRAAETGLPLVRAAHSGISMILSGSGEEMGRLDVGERGVLTAAVRVGGHACGARTGRIVAALCATLALVAIVTALSTGWTDRRRRRRPPEEGPAPTEDDEESDRNEG